MASHKLSVFVLMTTLVVILAADSLDCPENEIPLKCESERCFKTCDHLINFPPCPGSVAGPCTKTGCVCKDDYLRNDQGVCVKTTECPEWVKVVERNRKAGWTTFPESNERI
ncbi:trypsin inhibitor like cysteine rich domain-containing protein [Phthorimaea operculella]|nr:trypsin inhibitor like cysteine rich domain-containing protein [Phthorimaea operculella]